MEIVVGMGAGVVAYVVSGRLVELAVAGWRRWRWMRLSIEARRGLSAGVGEQQLMTD